VETPIGRKLRPKLTSHAALLVRVKPKDLAAAGIRRLPRVVGVRDGQPLLADQRVLEVANVIWCTGSGPDFSWIDLPVFGDSEDEPMHHRGVVATQPGLYFVGPAIPLRHVVRIPSRRRQGRRVRRRLDPEGSG
jgi:putative flavoprotein involved in K+ transport